MALKPIEEVEDCLANALGIDSLRLVEQYRVRRKLSTYASRAIAHIIYPITIIVCVIAAIYAALIR